MFVESGVTWIGFNAIHLPPRLPYELDSARDAQYPRCFNPKFPYLCAVQSQEALVGDFLSCFRGTPAIISTPGGYAMDEAQMKKWEAFENMTFHLCLALTSHVTLSLEFSLPKLPHRMGYKEVHRTHRKALGSAHSSRHAFYILFGMLSYLVARIPNWMEVADKAGLPDTWYKDLNRSPICDFSTAEGRVGVFVDLSEAESEIRILGCLISKRIPIWILWGDGLTYTPTLRDEVDINIARQFVPRDLAAQVDCLKAQLNDSDRVGGYDERYVWGDVWNDGADHGGSDCNVTIDLDIGQPLPLPPLKMHASIVTSSEVGQVEENSRQLPNETPEQFWLRQHADDKAKLALMTESERKRLKNERDGSGITQKSWVFYWENLGWGRVRRRIKQKEYDNYSDWPPSQMRFSITRNEWDICSDFDPGADAESLSDPDEEPDLNGSKETSGANLVDSTCGIHTSDHFLVNQYSQVPEEMALTEEQFRIALDKKYFIRDVHVRDLKDVGLEKMLYYRYGFRVEEAAAIVKQNPPETSIDYAKESWAKARGVLYDVESAVNEFTIHEMLSITSFVTSLLDGSSISPTVLDIQSHDTILEEAQAVAHALNLRKIHGVYLIYPNTNGYAIVLEDTSLVMEVIRRGVEARQQGLGLDVRDLVKLLAHRGSPFRTLCSAQQASIKLKLPPWGLGFRALDDPPYAFAYAQYEKMVQAFMLQPRARSALGLGGPVWRVIMECLNPSQAALGPSDDANNYGEKFVLSDDTSLWEDVLSESELLFLCGTYKVQKGQTKASICTAMAKFTYYLS